METSKKQREATILLVEDNPADQRLTIRAFKNANIKADIRIVNDGQEALDYLERKGEYSNQENTPIPDTILLDINMPRIDGKQFLKIIKNDKHLKTIPVIMLTTSDYERDIIESYQLGVNAYVSKPVQIEDFFEAIMGLENFWVNITTLPTPILKKDDIKNY
jgi:CheY-like chemotaxis protein